MTSAASLVDLTQLDASLVMHVYAQCVQLTADAQLSVTTRHLHPAVKCIRDLPIRPPVAHPRFDDVAAALNGGERDLSAMATALGLADAKACVDVVTETLLEENFASARCAAFPIVALMDAVRLGMQHVDVVRDEIIDMVATKATLTTHILSRMSMLALDVGGTQLALTLLARPVAVWADALAGDDCAKLQRHVDAAMEDLDALPLDHVDVSTGAIAAVLAAHQKAERELHLDMGGQSLSAQLARLRDDSVELLRDMQTEVVRATGKHRITQNAFRANLQRTQHDLAAVVDSSAHLPTVTASAESIMIDDDEGVTNVLRQTARLTKWAPDLLIDQIGNGDAVYGGRLRQLDGHALLVFDKAVCLGYDADAKTYTVQFDDDATRERHTLGVDAVAMTYQPMFEMPEGFRCIAEHPTHALWMSATIGARANAATAYRYMMMFDDGAVAYAQPADVKLCRSSAAVMGYADTYALIRSSWQYIVGDVPLGLPNTALTVQHFMHAYLEEHPNTPQIRPKIGVQLCVYRNGKSHLATPLSIDHQLVRMSIPLSKEDARKHGQSTIEDIMYRGSWRFKCINDERMEVAKSPSRRSHPARNSMSQMSTASQELDETAQRQNTALEWEMEQELGGATVEHPHIRRTQRSRKTSMPLRTPTINVKRDRMIDEVTDIYELKYMTVDTALATYPPAHAVCSRKCLPADDATIYATMKKRRLHPCSPLLWPMHVGWKRHMIQTTVSECVDDSTYQRKKRQEENKSTDLRHIQYVTPCGRNCTTLAHIAAYLSATASRLAIDLFTFDPLVEPRKIYHLNKPDCLVTDDFSKEGEPMVGIRMVNAIDDLRPDEVDYVARRFGNLGHELTTVNSGEWVSCCDCEDDCQSNDTCACRKLTADGMQRLHQSMRPVTKNDEDLFAYRRFNPAEDELETPVGLRSGVYECNERCACSRQTCHNRVAQTDMKWPLELFKTRGKGWGVRSLVDIPANHFVCIYAGAVHTDEGAEAIGASVADGDAYFADCDLIYVVDRAKLDMDLDNGDLVDTSFGDDNMDVGGDGQVPTADPTAVTSSAATVNGADGQSDARVTGSKKEVFSLRKYFEESHQLTFVVDARVKGNIGRYFNHSCEPNIMVQNMLVDTHDLRLPWIAFFTTERVTAGEELVWIYNYTWNDDRRIDCNCGSARCEKRMR